MNIVIILHESLELCMNYVHLITLLTYIALNFFFAIILMFTESLRRIFEEEFFELCLI